MDIFIDPSSGPYPWEVQDLGEWPAQVQRFIFEYFAFSEFLQDRGVSDQDKVEIFEMLFDPDWEPEGGRKMRRGLRRYSLDVAKVDANGLEWVTFNPSAASVATQ